MSNLPFLIVHLSGTISETKQYKELLDFLIKNNFAANYNKKPYQTLFNYNAGIKNDLEKEILESFKNKREAEFVVVGINNGYITNVLEELKTLFCTPDSNNIIHIVLHYSLEQSTCLLTKNSTKGFNNSGFEQVYLLNENPVFSIYDIKQAEMETTKDKTLTDILEEKINIVCWNNKKENLILAEKVLNHLNNNNVLKIKISK